MYKYMFLIFLSLGIHSHFVPLKITTSNSQHNIITATVKEIIALLNKVNVSQNSQEKFTTPENVTSENCSHNYIEKFIQELHKLKKNDEWQIENDMKVLEEKCPFLNKSHGNYSSCKTEITNFNSFKNKLETFVSWINEESTTKCCKKP